MADLRTLFYRVIVPLALIIVGSGAGLPKHALAAVPDVAADPGIAQVAAQAESYDEWMARAAQARQRGDLAAAIDHLRRALSIRPQDYEARVLLGQVLGFQRRFEEALTELAIVDKAFPRNTEVGLAIARIRSYSGIYDAAEANIAEVLNREPNNVEAIALKARIQYYRKQFGEAEAGFTRALALAPNDLEALLGLGDVRSALGDSQAALEHYRRAQIIAPESADVTERLARASAGAGPLWRLDIGHTFSAFERQGRSNWQESYLGLSRQLDRATTLRGRVERDQRFDNIDTFLQAGVDHRFADWLAAAAQFGGSPNPDFLLRWSAGAGASLRVRSGGDAVGPTILTFDTSLSRYRTGDVAKLNPGIEQYVWNGRAWLTGRFFNIIDETDRHLTGWLARADIQINDALRIYAGYSDAPETVQSRTVDTQTILGGILYDLTDRLGLRLDYARDDRQGAYIRHGLGAGLTVRF